MNKTKVIITPQTSWNLVHRAALATTGKKPVHGPSEEWIKKMLLARHSVIRCRTYWIEVHDIPYFVAMHFVRHNVGVTWFVQTSREDRTGVPREERRQTDLVNMSCFVNAEALMNIANKRMCGQADIETRRVMYAIKREMLSVDPIMSGFLEPACLHQGGECHELRSCGLRPNKEIE